MLVLQYVAYERPTLSKAYLFPEGRSYDPGLAIPSAIPGAGLVDRLLHS